MRAWAELPFGEGGGPVGLAAATEETVVDYDIRSSRAWAPWKPLALSAGVRAAWAVPVFGADGLTGVITVFRRSPLPLAAGHPPRDELRLVTLYAGYAASAVERERLLGEVTARNRVLETIQEVLETLAGPIPLEEGLAVVLHALCQGLQAGEVGLFSEDRGGRSCAPRRRRRRRTRGPADRRARKRRRAHGRRRAHRRPGAQRAGTRRRLLSRGHLHGARTEPARSSRTGARTPCRPMPRR